MEKWNLKIGSVVIECDAQLARLVGFSGPYANDESRTARDEGARYGSGCKLDPTALVAIALSEGCTGEMAVMRAVALRHAGIENANALLALKTAELNADAARENLRAEQIRSARQKREMRR